MTSELLLNASGPYRFWRYSSSAASAAAAVTGTAAAWSSISTPHTPHLRQDTISPSRPLSLIRSLGCTPPPVLVVSSIQGADGEAFIMSLPTTIGNKAYPLYYFFGTVPVTSLVVQPLSST